MQVPLVPVAPAQAPQPPMVSSPSTAYSQPVPSPIQPQPMPGAFSSPLQSGAPAPAPVVSPAGFAGVNPQIAAPIASGPGALDDGDLEVSVDDEVWISRAKRVIAETKGNPHRQTQLIQHLRSQYLKQKFGRQVGMERD